MSAGLRVRALVVLGVELVGLAVATGCSKKRPPPPQPAEVSTDSMSAAPAPNASALSDREGERLVENACLSCHSAEMIAQQRLTPAQWSRVVPKMVDWGALLEPAEIAPLIGWLSTKYGVAARPFAPKRITATEAAEAIMPLPDGPFAGGDPDRGRDVYVEHCSGCHGPDARGHIGVNLRDRPFLFRARPFADTVHQGRGKMMPIRISDAAISDVLAYLRRLPLR